MTAQHQMNTERNAIVIDGRFRGPLGMSNGGFTAGTLASGWPGPTRVRIESPVPSDTPLAVRPGRTQRLLALGESILARAEMVAESLEPPPFLEADLILGNPLWKHGLEFYADCFVCGRPAPDGLGIKLRSVGAGSFGAVWRPADCDAIGLGPVPEQFLWAGLDCPGGYAALAPHQKIGLLGSLTVDIRFRPDADQPLVVVGQATVVDGRKLGAATGIYTSDGDLAAVGSALWIALREPV